MVSKRVCFSLLAGSSPSTQPSMATLKGRVAVITGASRGIGRAIAIRLAKEGAHIVLSARDQDALDAAVHEIKESGGEAASLAADLRRPDAAQRLADFALQTFRQIDIVVTGETRNWLTLRGFEETLKDMAQRRWRKYKSSGDGNWPLKSSAGVEESEVHLQSD